LARSTLRYLILALLLAAASSPVSAACEAARVKLQMLGTRGPELLDGRASSGYLVWLDGKARIIVDAGAGTVQRFEQSGARFEDVDLMVFTHFHADHSSDFPAYIKGAFFTERAKTLHVVGPSGNKLVPSAEEFVERMVGARNGAYPYLGDYLDPGSARAWHIRPRTIPWSDEDLAVREVYRDRDFVVRAVPVHHGPFPALGFRIELAGCALAFTGDMSGRLGQMPGLARNADILVAHNAIPEDATGVAALLHMTPGYIGELAEEARVKRLVLTHLMARTINRRDETLARIRAKYKGPVSFPDDLDVLRP